MDSRGRGPRTAHRGQRLGVADHLYLVTGRRRPLAAPLRVLAGRTTRALVRTVPRLEVVARSLPEPAHLAVLDASKVAQLTVVGRHTSPHLSGFRIGSTARSVLNAAERPVAVIPAPFEDPTILGEEAREGVRR